jgi:hypothetical protein
LGFQVFFQESTRKHFPSPAKISIGSTVGPLVYCGATSVDAMIDLGGTSGKLLKRLSENHFISKHGSLRLELGARAGWADEVLGAYVEFRAYFKESFGYTPFIFYGTLLGFERSQDFIARDSDFDTAYLSRETTPEAVKAEMIAIMERMSRDGCSFRAEQRFFRYKKGRVHLDVSPGWVSDGRLWVANTTSIPADRSMIEPLREVEFKGWPVHVPNQTTSFLEAKYGSNWRTPDPGYHATTSARAEAILERAQLTNEEMAQLNSMAARDPV